MDFRFSIVEIGQEIKFCTVRIGNKRCSISFLAAGDN